MLTIYSFSSVIDQYLHEPYASLLNGIIFGLKPKTSSDFYFKLKAVGLLHIVVLSGMNLTLLSGVISSALKNLGRKIASLITILGIIIFINFVGPQAPIVRAGFMAILTHVAIIYGEQRNSLLLLLFSGILSLIFKPAWIKSLSFQLSYLATLGILLFGKPTPSRKKDFFDEIKNVFKNEFKTSIAAQIFTAPLIFLKFHQISLVSPFTNVLVAPTIAPLMILGLLAAVLGKINFYLGLPFAWLCFGILRYILFVIDLFSKVPFGFLRFNAR